MTALIMMYVFYDRNGDIKAITPTLDEYFSTIFHSATFPLTEVDGFLRAEKNTFDYQVKKFETLTSEICKIVKKKSQIAYIKTLDNYLTKVEDVDGNHNTLIITNNVSDRVIGIELTKDFKELIKLGDNETQDIINEFMNCGPSMIYITAKNNPYHLLFSFSFTPAALVDARTLYFKYNDVCSDTSAYTKKLIAGYGFKERVR